MSTLKRIRKIRGLTQGELAKMAGTSAVNISYLEVRKRGMSEEWIEKLSEALQCTKAQLLGEQSLEGLGKEPDEARQDQRTFLSCLRVSKGLSINELANKIDVSRQLIWAFENGKSTLSREVFEKIAEALNVSVECLMAGKEEAKQEGIRLVSNNKYPLNETYLGYAMEIVDQTIDPEFHSREEKQHMLTEAYKMVYDFFEHKEKQGEYVEGLKGNLRTTQGFLKFIEKDRLPNPLQNGRSSKRISSQKS